MELGANKKFSDLKFEAEQAADIVSLYRVVYAATAKLQRNIGKAQFIACMNGQADSAHDLFENVIPRQRRIVNEIIAIWTRAASGRSAEEIVSIITEVTTDLAAA